MPLNISTYGKVYYYVDNNFTQWCKKVNEMTNSIEDNPFSLQFETYTNFFQQFQNELNVYNNTNGTNITANMLFIRMKCKYTDTDGSSYTFNVNCSSEREYASNNIKRTTIPALVIPSTNAYLYEVETSNSISGIPVGASNFTREGIYMFTPVVSFYKSATSNVINTLYTLTGNTLTVRLKDPEIVAPVPIVMIQGNTSYRVLNNNERFTKDINIDIQNKVILYSDCYIQLQELDENGNAKSNWITDTRLPRFFDSEGTFKIKFSARMKSTGFLVYITRTIALDKGIAYPLKIYGVTEGAIAKSFTIYVEYPTKKNNVYDSIKLVKVVDNTTTNLSTTGTVIDYKPSPTSDTVKCLKFNITDVGTYDIIVTSKHTVTGLKAETKVRTFTVKNEQVLQPPTEIPGDDQSGGVRFKNPYPQHSAYYYIMSANPNYNKVNYTSSDGLNPNGEEEWYSSPVLHFDNFKIDANDNKGFHSFESYGNESGQSNNVTHYEPEHPRIVDVEDGGVYNTERHIRFVNLATKPDEAIFYIFLDGKLLTDPFNNTFDLFEDGYHFINIITMNKIRPWYYFTIDSYSFLIKNQSFVTIRKPKIILHQSSRDEYTDVVVKFSNVNEDFKHSVSITYFDTSIPEENYTYPYDIKEVKYRIYNNCHIVATTELVENNIVAKDEADITNNFTENPPINDPIDDIEIFGPITYPIKDGDFVKNISVGQYFIAGVKKNLNVEYKAYLNGYPYEFGTLITNREPEIKKYTLEIYMINKWNPSLVSYYTKEFIVDTIMLPYPLLMNIHPNIMNRMKNKNRDTISDLNEPYIPKSFVLKAQNFYLPDTLEINHYTRESYLLSDEEAVLLFNKEVALEIESATTSYKTIQNNTVIDSSLQSFVKDIFLENRIIDIKAYVIPLDDEYILSVTYKFYNGCIRTNSFYFSINTNPKRPLFPNKGILKVVDYKTALQEDDKEDKDGEFVIDRITGHLWYNKEGVITPITKQYEDKILEVEEKLLAIEDEHIKFIHLYNYVSYYVDSLLERAEKFYLELRNKYEELLYLGLELKKIWNQIIGFEDELREFEQLSHENDAKLKMRKEEIIKWTDKTKALNDEFESFTASLRNTFTRAAKVTYCAYNLEPEINRCKTYVEFNEFKDECLEKINKLQEWAEKQKYLKDKNKR